MNRFIEFIWYKVFNQSQPDPLHYMKQWWLKAEQQMLNTNIETDGKRICYVPPRGLTDLNQFTDELITMNFLRDEWEHIIEALRLPNELGNFNSASCELANRIEGQLS